uniref:Uncharacterized protein n=1 Tax=Rhizophora mucronata TaxID=61149 RepID=A0A2P2N1F0_RHIMU
MALKGSFLSPSCQEDPERITPTLVVKRNNCRSARRLGICMWQSP